MGWVGEVKWGGGEGHGLSCMQGQLAAGACKQAIGTREGALRAYNTAAAGAAAKKEKIDKLRSSGRAVPQPIHPPRATLSTNYNPPHTTPPHSLVPVHTF